MSDLLPPVAGPVRAAKLGEELPIFCEKCGYSLFGLPPVRCDQCSVVQLNCPECGHHQPVNTLRPAFQKFLGRFRAGIVIGVVLVKLIAMTLILFGWLAMGVEWSYKWDYQVTAQGRMIGSPRRIPSPVTTEQLVAFSLFGVAWGMVARMMLLRWRRGWIVGLVLGTLAVLVVLLGAYVQKWERSIYDRNPLPDPVTFGFLKCLALTLVTTVAGAAVVWGIWWALVHTLLPKRTAQALIAWQEGMSTKEPAPQNFSSLARE